VTRTYDRNRPVNRNLPPTDVAEYRARRLADPLDRVRFMEAFGQARVAEARQDPRLDLWLRAALEDDDSVRVAGLIEGVASVVVPGDGKGMVL